MHEILRFWGQRSWWIRLQLLWEWLSGARLRGEWHWGAPHEEGGYFWVSVCSRATMSKTRGPRLYAAWAPWGVQGGLGRWEWSYCRSVIDGHWYGERR